MRRDAFGSYHPALVFGFFIAAIVITVVVNNPLFVATSCICAAIYYLFVVGRQGWKTITGMIPLFLIVAAVNPLLNTMGDTVLFTWLGDRPYTLEALVYGISVSCMLISALLWFSSYNKIMTSDKFTYLFGALAPALTLVFTMVLRLVPTYQRKIGEISTARACVGRSSGEGKWRQRASDGLALLSALVTWALEGSIITADSMRSRGYGVGKRTSYARYPFTLRDVALLLAMLALLGCTIACVAMGAGAMEYYPTIAFPPLTPVNVIGFIAYLAFLLVPSFIDIKEDISWRISLSRI